MSPSSEPHDADHLNAVVAQCIEAARTVGLEDALRDVCARHPADAEVITRRVRRLARAGLVEHEPESTSETETEAIPERLGDYLLQRRLGAGGMGVVYLARHAELGREVAIKVVRPELLFFPGARARFRREVEAVARLNHAGIVAIHAVGEEQGVPYFAMEYVPGATLAEALQRLRGRDPAQLRGEDLWTALVAAAAEPAAPAPDLYRGSWTEVALRVAIALSSALAHAHAHGLVHRDVKPSNVMLGRDGRVCLFDFGLAAGTHDAQLTGTGSALGSVPYMAPEQVRGDRDALGPWTDVWGVGAVLHELLTLAPPFGGNADESTRLRILQGTAEAIGARNALVPWDVRTVCETALSVDPRQRYRDAEALAADLRAALAWQPIRARRPSAWTALRRWAQRRPGWAVGVAAALVALVVGPLLVTLASARERDAALAAKAAAEQKTYAASIAAADLALRAFEVRQARRYLQRCPESERRWEWDHLTGLADGAEVVLAVTPSAGRAGVTDDSQRVAVVDAEGLRVYEDAGRGPVVFTSQQRAWRDVVLLPGGQRAVGLDRSGDLVRIDFPSGQHERLAVAPGATQVHVVGPLLLAQVQTQGLVVLELDSGRLLRRIEFGPTERSDAAFALWDGREVYALNFADKVVVRALRDETEVLRFAVPGASRIALAPDGRRLAVCDVTSGDVTVYASDGTKLTSRAAAARGGLILAYWGVERIVTGASNGALTVFDATSLEVRERLLGHTSSVDRVASFAGGTQLVTRGADATLRTWSAGAGGARWDLPAVPIGRASMHTPRASALAVSRDGRQLAVGHSDGTVSLVDVEDGTPRFTLERQRRRIRALGFDAIGARLAASADDGTLVLYDTTAGTLLHEIALPTPRVLALSVAADGAQVAVFSDGSRIDRVDLRAGAQVRSVEAIGAAAVARGFDAQGDLWWLARDGKVWTWAFAVERPALAVAPTADPLVQQLFAPTWGRVLAEVVVEESSVGHRGLDVRLLADPLAQTFWSGSASGEVRVWDGRVGEAILTLMSDGRLVTDLCLTDDGERLFVAHYDGITVFERHGRAGRGFGRQRAAAAAARAWVTAATSEPATTEELLARLGADAAQPTEQVERIRAHLRALGSDVERFSREAAATARVQTRGVEAVARAARFCDRALALDPQFAPALGTRALLASRNQDWAMAVNAASAALELGRDPLREPEPECLAVLAGVQARLGRRAEAEAVLQRLEQLMSEPRFANDASARAFHASAKRLVELSEQRR